MIPRAARFLQRLLVRSVGRLQARSHTSPIEGTAETAAAWVRAGGRGSVVDIAGDSPIHVPPVDTVCGAVPVALAAANKLVFPPLYAAMLPEARILDGEGFIIADDRLILDMSPQYARGRHDHPALLRWRLPPPERLDTTALVLTGIDLRNHYHWLLDVLPRFEVARLAGLSWDHVIAPSVTPAHRACLQRLGIDQESIIPPPWNRQLLVREAILGAFPSLRYAPSPFAVRFLRRLFADCLGKDRSLPRRIFISRKHCKQRRISKEAEVESTLSSRGFRTIFLENLSIEDQARVFANAEIVIAPHGAGLTNAAFCRPGTRLIEFFSARYTPGFYRHLAAVCELDYACMVDGCRPRGGLNGRHSADDMRVDLVCLDSLL